jgi:thiol-disulfide isomerase/thioredoxin
MRYLWYVLLICAAYGLWLNYYTVVPPEIREVLPFSKTSSAVSSAPRPGLLERVERRTYPPLTNEALPSFSMRGINGGAWNEDSFSGQKTLLVFFASWCGACVQNMPNLHAMRQTYPNLRLVGVVYEDTPSKARAMLAQHGGDPFHQLLIDRTGSAARAFQVQGIPAQIFIDRNGAMRHRTGGYRAGDMVPATAHVMEQM